MFTKLRSWGLHRNTNFVIVTVVVLVLIAAGVLLGIHNSNSGKNKPAEKHHNASYDYTFENAQYSCRQVKAHPTGEEMINYCSGKLTVKVNKTNESRVYNITSTTYLYKTGALQNMATVTQLSKDKTKLYLTFFPGSKTDLATIGYQAQ